jgi:hypothetical protein
MQDLNLLVARWGDESVGDHFLSIDCVLYSGRINLTIISNMVISVDITKAGIGELDIIDSCDKESKLCLKLMPTKSIALIALVIMASVKLELYN